jgi:putative nucleotidyltransferase with HDIG domain
MTVPAKSAPERIQADSALGPVGDFRALERLAVRLNARVPGSIGHSRRVSGLAAAVAIRMRLEAGDVERIAQAGALHDIGKIEVPVNVLNKPSPLTEAEYVLVKSHVGLGAEMVSGLGDDGLVAIIRHHHERFDGSGYPSGLAGERIPLGARIVAVADTFDAVTSVRPYRPAKRRRAALDLLEAEAGTQLDPGVVAAFRGVYSGPRGRLRLRRNR